jgi:hypothetical protein
MLIPFRGSAEIPVCARNNEDQDQLFAAMRELGRRMDIGIEMVPVNGQSSWPFPKISELACCK